MRTTDENTHPYFLNVDLDVHALIDPQPLIDHWQGTLIPLVVPIDTATPFVRFEHKDASTDAVALLYKFCDLVEALPPTLQAFWIQCPKRILDIGYDSGTETPISVTALPADLLANLSKHFTQLSITIYPTP